MSKVTVNNGGLGFIGALTITFIVLKFTKVIAWPWIWVLSPLVAPIGIFLILLITIGVFVGLWKLVELIFKR